MPALHPDIQAALARQGAPRLTVVRAGGLGDTLLTLPALQLLRDAVPGARITLVGSVWAERLLPLLHPRPHLVRFDSPRLTAMFGPKPAPDETGPFSGAHLVVVYSSGAGDDAFLANVRACCPGLVVAHPVEPAAGLHAALHLARAVADMPNLSAVPLPELHVPDDLLAWAAGWLAERLPGAGRVVAVHPGSGGRAKCWPAERFAALIRALGVAVVLIEGPADGEPCRRVVDLLDADRPVARAAGLSVPQVAALLLQCAGYVGNDSGLTHLAAALGVRTAAVFGPTEPGVWRPLGPRVCLLHGDPWPTVAQVRSRLGSPACA